MRQQLSRHQNQYAWIRAGVKVLIPWKCRPLIEADLRRSFAYFPAYAETAFSGDFPSRVGSAGTVTYACLQLAAYLNVSKIVIVGMDHSFAVENDKKNVIAEVSHEQDVNHFDPNYFAKGQLWGQPNLDKSEVGYIQAPIF